MVNGTVVLSVIVRHGVGRLQVQMRFCYTNDRVLSHGVGRGLIFGPMDEAGARSRVEAALDAMGDTTCRVGEGVMVTDVRVDREEVEVSVRARPRVSALPPVLVGVVVPELERTSSARVRPL